MFLYKNFIENNNGNGNENWHFHTVLGDPSAVAWTFPDDCPPENATWKTWGLSQGNWVDNEDISVTASKFKEVTSCYKLQPVTTYYCFLNKSCFFVEQC